VTFQAEKSPVVCPKCKQQMKYDQRDNFYQCPGCGRQLWLPENACPCPVCGRPMRYKSPGYHSCTGCGSELWPPEEEEGEEDPERHVSYAGLDMVYIGELKRGYGHSKSSGRKRKKQKTGPRVISQRYLLY